MSTVEPTSPRKIKKDPRDVILRGSNQRWNAAVDWLLNSRYTAEPYIQEAFWGIVEGECTVNQADSGEWDWPGREVLDD